MSLIRRTACARAQFNVCSSTTNAHSETGQMAVCCQNLTLGALGSRSALSVLVDAPIQKCSLLLNTPCTPKVIPKSWISELHITVFQSVLHITVYSLLAHLLHHIQHITFHQ
jgi:hypothetical protein